MKIATPIAGALALLAASAVCAQDWPQWRGPNRDAKATGFTAPATWPKELTKKWSEKVGDGVATPALVGDNLYVIARQGSNEVVRCMDAATGKEKWSDKYEEKAATGPASGFPGPRCSPVVAGGKLVTLGCNGTLSCYDAASGKMLWRNTDHKGSVPRFSTSSSPLIADGLCIVQVGGDRGGAVIAYELDGGKEKWKWTADGTAYASPSLLSTGDSKVLVAETAAKIVGLSMDGKLLWETPFPVGGGGGGGGGGRGYNAASPMVEGQTVYLVGSGRGVKAVKLDKGGDGLTAKELWANKDNSVQFNTPVLKDGVVYGLSANNTLFTISAETGKTGWTAPGPASGGGRMGGYGSIVDAGPVLFALTPGGKLVVFQPSDKEYKEVASYKVADGYTYAYPVISGNRIFIKDRDAVTLWTIE